MNANCTTSEDHAAAGGAATITGTVRRNGARARRVAGAAGRSISAAAGAVRRGYSYQRYRIDQMRVLRKLDDVILRDIGIVDRGQISIVADAMARAAVRRDEERRGRAVVAA